MDSSDGAIDTDLCELVETGQDVVLCNDNSDEQYLCQAQFNQTKLLAPLLNSVSAAANDHLEKVLLICKRKKQEALQAQRASFQGQIAELQGTIEQLNEQLSVVVSKNNQLSEQLLARGEVIAAVRWQSRTPACNILRLTSKYLSFWKQWVSEKKSLRKMDSIVNRFQNKARTASVFNRLLREHTHRKNIREREEYARNMNEISRNALSDYESEIELLKARVIAAEKQAGAEHALRLKMEEDMKRLLLKNMATMNMEALSVFHQHIFPEGEEELKSHFPSPAEDATNAILEFVNSTGSKFVSESLPNNEETFLLTKFLELRQNRLKQEVGSSPGRAFARNVNMPSPSYTTQPQLDTGSRYSGVPVPPIFTSNDDEDTPRSFAPVPLAINVKPGQQYSSQHMAAGPRKAWRGSGALAPALKGDGTKVKSTKS